MVVNKVLSTSMPVFVAIGGGACLVLGHALLGAGLLSACGVYALWRVFAARVRAAGANGSVESSGTDPVRELKRQLGRAQFLEHIDTAVAERAQLQLTTMVTRRQRFDELLRRKFEKEELTFGRYSSATDRVVEAVMANLREIASLFSRLDGMQLDELRLALKKVANPEEAKALTERVTLGEKMSTDINSLLVRNEGALTEFDKITAAIAAIKTSKDGAADWDGVMRDLQELAQRAQKYSL